MLQVVAECIYFSYINDVSCSYGIGLYSAGRIGLFLWSVFKNVLTGTGVLFTREIGRAHV